MSSQPRRRLSNTEHADEVDEVGEMSAADTDSPPRPAILELPVEVFLAIADHLPLSAQVAFTLTCREILRKYGLVKWDDISRFQHQRMRLLHLLEREPGYYVLAKPFGYAITWDHLALYLDQDARNSGSPSISLDHFSHSSSITVPQLK